ncbi:MAG TPA: hypothetical protein VKB54_09405 [Solirubrobacteraceae bacterium]|nr:hypothetical protein [Solirubrobacteraceae bacterium]
MSHRHPLVAALAALCFLAAPTASSADVSLSNVAARPCGTSALAGSHQDFCISFDVGQTGGDDLKDLAIHLAPGLIGDPSATPKCPQATFRTGTCPANTQVGEVSTTAAGLDVLPLTLSGKVWNVEPNANEPARLGISIPAVITTIRLETTVRARLSDYGLDTVTTGIPDSAAGLPITITHMALTLWGAKGDHSSLGKPFVTLPTSCQPATTSIDVTAYKGGGTGGSDSFTPTDCAHVPFTPSLVVGPKQSQPDTPGEATATLVVPAPVGDNRVQANVKRVELRLPAGLALSPGLANGLTACTEDQFGLKEDRPPQCPASSEIGDVRFDTPLIGTLTGKVYFGTPTPTAKLRNFVSVEDPRLRVKLIGDVVVDPTTGQVTNVFADSPQVPFTQFFFRYKGGPRAVLTSPPACGTYTATATMTPFSGTAAATPSDTGDVVGCGPLAFTPSLGLSSSTTQAGADTALTVRIDRPDRQARLLRSTVSLPPGLAGRLGAVPACPVDQARAAACGEDSRVGSATVVVGNGDEPLALGARVYLTQAFGGGVAGLAIVVPAKVGPIDLGTVVTLAKLTLRPDAGIDVETEDLPQIVGGIPTPYRTIALTIDRPGFMLNPTSCAPLPAHGAFTATGGQQAAADASYQPTGCDRQPYAPKLTATIGSRGQTGKGSHPPLTTVVTQRPGEANSRHVEVTLPSKLGADINALRRSCPAAKLDANACPSSAIVGTVRADTPLLPAPLSGPVLLVTPKNGPLPELALDLHGPIDLRLRATVGFASGGRLKTIFDGIPDVPLTRLALTFTGGKNGILSSGRDLCASPPVTLQTGFQSHGGAKRSGTVRAQVACGAASSSRLKATATLTGVKHKRPALRLKLSAPSRITRVRVTLPKQLRGKRGARSVTVKLRKAGTRTADVRLRRGALRLVHTVKAGQRVTFTVTAVRTNGKKLTAKVTPRARA